MDKELVEKFNEKNQTMLKEKLVLDINNNKDSLFQALENYFKQKFIETRAHLIDIYQSAGTVLENKKLAPFLNNYANMVQGVAKKLILDKMKEMHAAASNVTLDESTIEEYCKKISDTTQNYQEKFLQEIEEYLDKEIPKHLLRLAKDKDETTIAHRRAKDLLTKTLPNSLAKKIVEYLKDRDGAISNNARESYQKIKKMNELSTGVHS